MTEENYKDCTTEPIPDKNKQIYVTAESAKKAAWEVIGRHVQPHWDEVKLQREEIYNEILNKYVQAALPTNEEQKTLRLTNTLQVCYKREGKTPCYYEIYDLHRDIKPVAEPVEIPLALYLALNEIDNRSRETRATQERMADRLFEELMYMKEKPYIEAVFPEMMPLLEFKTFCYDTEFWKDILSEKK